MSMTHGPIKTLELIDDPKAPETYVDEAAGFAMVNGTVCLTFAAVRWGYSQTSDNNPKRLVNCRLRMPVVAAQNLAVSLFDFLAKQGFGPAGKPTDVKLQ